MATAPGAAIGAAPATPLSISHDEGSHAFFAALPGSSEKSHLDYELRAASPASGGRQVCDMTHTVTAPAQRGMGIAGQMAEAALSHAHSRGMAVQPTCSYIASFLAKGKGSAAKFAADPSGSGLWLPK